MGTSRRAASAAAGLVVVCGLTSCGGSSQPTATSSAGTPTSAASPVDPTPHGLIAIGHSALTAEGTNRDEPGVPALENSFATGTNPAVQSLYLRMIALDPSTKGHVTNAARGGSSASELVEQAKLALATVPNPRLVLIQTVDSDIRCDGSDAQRYEIVAGYVKDALDEIVSAAPKTRILVLGQRGRPLPSATAMSKTPAAVAAFSGDGPCDGFGYDGRINRAHIANLTAIIEGYEAAVAKVCATVPQCRTDKGRFASLAETSADYLPDYNHLNLQGQAKSAAWIWPAVEAVLREP